MTKDEELEQPAPSWQGLSDDEILDIKDKLQKKWMLEVFNPNINSDIEFSYAIEQALKEKNT